MASAGGMKVKVPPWIIGSLDPPPIMITRASVDLFHPKRVSLDPAKHQSTVPLLFIGLEWIKVGQEKLNMTKMQLVIRPDS